MILPCLTVTCSYYGSDSRQKSQMCTRGKGCDLGSAGGREVTSLDVCRIVTDVFHCSAAFCSQSETRDLDRVCVFSV
jgi:hypothetical protein